MHQLAIMDDDVAWPTDIRDSLRQSFRPVGLDHRCDIQFAQFVGARHRPHRVGGRAAVEHGLKGESMDFLIPRRAVPVSDAILVPGNRGTEAGFLDENGFVERNKIITMDGSGNSE